MAEIYGKPRKSGDMMFRSRLFVLLGLSLLCAAPLSAQRGRGYYATRKGATEGNQLLFRRWGGGSASST